MSDITKCAGDNCPWRNSCKRYTAPANPLNQSWFWTTPGFYRVASWYPMPMNDDGSFPSEENAEWTCDHFIQHEKVFNE